MASDAEQTWREKSLQNKVDALEKTVADLEKNVKLTMHHFTERYDEQIATLADRVTLLTDQISKLQVQIQAQGDAEKATEQ